VGIIQQENPHVYTIYLTSPSTGRTQLEVLRVGMSVVLSCHVCGIMISIGVKSVICLLLLLLLGIVLLRCLGMCPSIPVHIHPHKSSPRLVIENWWEIKVSCS